MSSKSLLSHCVIIPFYNRIDQVHACLESLLAQAEINTEFLLVNDASTELLEPLSLLLDREDVHLIQHSHNEGVSAARNSALHWCRSRGFELAIMIDSDCLPGPGFISKHLALHQQYSDAACIGAAIIGRGETIWARLDGVASWVHAAPHYPLHRVEYPYHLPTTNFSMKVSLLPSREFVFDERLFTGEDCLLIREYRRNGLTVLFSPEPEIYHRDRDRLLDVVRHHYKWGHHQYFIQLGGDISPRVFNPLYRLIFLLLFFPLWPLFSLAGACLNIMPWISSKPAYSIYAPAIYILWLAKGLAVMEAAVRPRAVLRKPREMVSYQQSQGD